MYYKLEWNEENTNHFQRVFQAKDVATLWKAVHYMNLERNDQHRLIMEKLQITILEEYWENYSIITGSYTRDLHIDINN